MYWHEPVRTLLDKRPYEKPQNGTYQYVPTQVRTESWQDLAKLEMVKTCLNHVQTCLYLYRNVEPVHMMFVPVYTVHMMFVPVHMIFVPVYVHKHM